MSLVIPLFGCADTLSLEWIHVMCCMSFDTLSLLCEHEESKRNSSKPFSSPSLLQRVNQMTRYIQSCANRHDVVDEAKQQRNRAMHFVGVSIRNCRVAILNKNMHYGMDGGMQGYIG